MSYDDSPRSRRNREPRYVDTAYDDGYLRPHGGTSHDLIPARGREGSDYSVEEVPRAFPPPGYSSSGRPRSADPGYYERYQVSRSGRGHEVATRQRGYYDDNDSYYEREYDRRVSRKSKGSGHGFDDSEERRRRRVISKQQQILAAVAGAALAAGSKELFDRYEAKKSGGEVKRNLLLTAGLAAGGAVAGYGGTEVYNRREAKEKMAHGGRGGYSSDSEEDSKDKKSHKSFLEGALAAAGLGGAVKALTGGSSKDDDRSDTRSRRGSDGGRSTKSGYGKNSNAQRIQKAAMASLIAGATEAFRVSREPGSWKGEKAKRVLTAAMGAGAVDSARDPEKDGKRHLAQSVIAGLVGNRVLHGSRSNIEEDKKTGRSRSRSRHGSGSGSGGVSGLAALATAGLGALATKKVVDKVQESRSRSRGPRGRSPGSDYSDRSRSRSRSRGRGGSPDRHTKRSRSQSVVDKTRNALAVLGIGSGAADDDDRRSTRGGGRRRHDSDSDSRDGHGQRYSRGGGGGRGRHDSDSDSRDDHRHGSTRSGGGRSHRDHGDRYYSDEDDRSYRGGGRSTRSGGGRPSRHGGDSSRGGSDTEDLGHSSEDERRLKKTKGKQIITTGLAAVATIHAAHNVYSSMEKRKKRQKAVREGRLTKEEARKLKTKALLQDAASVGIAALGIKGAMSEIKEVNELGHEVKQIKEEKRRRHERRELKRSRALSISSWRARSRAIMGRDRSRGSSRRRGDNDDDDWYDSSDDDRDGRRHSDQEYDYGRLDRIEAAKQPPRLAGPPEDRAARRPFYKDDNTYGPLPAPPVGRDRLR